MKKFLLVFTVAFMMFSCSSGEPLPTEETNLERYTGVWYEVAKIPNRFQEGLECVTATYTKKWNGRIEVLNKGYKETTGELVSIKGEAKPVDSPTSGKLKVTFFWPFYGDYYIIDRGDDYEYALVGSPSREFLWILSREKQLDQSKIDELKTLASSYGFDVSKVVNTNQDCD